MGYEMSFGRRTIYDYKYKGNYPEIPIDNVD